MRTISSNLIIILIIFIFNSCNNTQNSILDLNEVKKVFSEIRNIQLDKLKNIDAFYRNYNLLVIRYLDDTCNYSQFLLKEEENNLYIKTGENNWKSINDFELNSSDTKNDINKENLKYIYHIMYLNKPIEINSSCNNDAISFKKKGYTIINTNNAKDYFENIENAEYQQLDTNWWLLYY